MFARIVKIPLKPVASVEFAKAIEEAATPLLRRHKGFRDEIALISSDGTTALGISFWDSKENAEAYDRSGFAAVMKTLEKVLGGPTELETCEVTNSTAHKIAPALVA